MQFLEVFSFSFCSKIGKEAILLYNLSNPPFCQTRFSHTITYSCFANALEEKQFFVPIFIEIVRHLTQEFMIGKMSNVRLNMRVVNV